MCVVFSLLSTACTDVGVVAPAASPDGPAHSIRAEKRLTYGDAEWTPDWEEARIAREETPGYAGVIEDADGQLTLLLADTSRAQGKVQDVRSRLRSHGERRTLGRHRRVAFDFNQLKVAFDSMHRAGLARARWTLLDIEEARNHVLIGVQAASDSQIVERQLKRLDLPRAMFQVELRPTPTPVSPAMCQEGDPDCSPPNQPPYDDTDPSFGTTSSAQSCVGLQCSQSPLVGGLEISIQVAPYTPSACTLGAIAQFGPYSGFITASHCTFAEQGTLDGTLFFQGPLGDYVARKLIDPAYSTGLLDCMAGYYCRNSDSQFAELSGTRSYALGYIAAPATSNSSDTTFAGLTISSLQGYRIYQERRPPSVLLTTGTLVTKVGRTTGQTSGTVVNTCAYTSAYSNQGRAIEILCIDKVDGIYPNIRVAGHGDSGGPVFTLLGGSSVMLEGIVSSIPSNGANSYYFSPFFSIVTDLRRNLSNASFSTTAP